MNLRSPVITPSELARLLHLCAIFYEPKKPSLIAKLNYPRYWRVRYQGRGLLKFSKTSRVRIKPIPPLSQVLKPVAQPMAHAPLTISLPAPTKIKLPSVQSRSSMDATTNGHIKLSTSHPPPRPTPPVPATASQLMPFRGPESPAHTVPAKTQHVAPSPTAVPALRKSLIVKLKVGRSNLGPTTPFAPLPGQSFAALQRSTTSYGPVNGNQNGHSSNGHHAPSPFPTASPYANYTAMSPPPVRPQSGTGHNKQSPAPSNTGAAYSPITTATATPTATNKKKRRQSEAPQPTPPAKKSLKIKLGLGKAAMNANNFLGGGPPGPA